MVDSQGPSHLRYYSDRWRQYIIPEDLDRPSTESIRGTVSKRLWVTPAHPEGRLVAVKRIGNTPKSKKRFEREITIWAGAKEHTGNGHQNIVPLLGVHVDHRANGLPEDNRSFVSPWYEDNNAETFLRKIKYLNKNFCPTDRLYLLQIIDVANGLQYMHSIGLVHADLNPTNILIERINGGDHGIRYRALISDFNLSRYSDRPGLTTTGDHLNGVYSSPEYGKEKEGLEDKEAPTTEDTPPEDGKIEDPENEETENTGLLGDGDEGKTEETKKTDKGSKRGDVWTFGITAHYLMTTSEPCRCPTWGLYNKHNESPCPTNNKDWQGTETHLNRYPRCPAVDQPLYGCLWELLMGKCWKWKPKERATMTAIVDELERIKQILELFDCTCPQGPDGGAVAAPV